MVERDHHIAAIPVDIDCWRFAHELPSKVALSFTIEVSRRRQVMHLDQNAAVPSPLTACGIPKASLASRA